MPQPDPIVSIVLAAGSGSRFGGRKQLADLAGRPLIEHAVTAALATSTAATLVVLGAYADEIAKGADLGAATVIACEDWAEGTGASLRAGLRATAGACTAAVITLADQPFVAGAATERLIAARGGDRAALRATYGGRIGHPVLIERRLFPALIAPGPGGDPQATLRAAGVAAIECGDLGDPGDVDTVEQLDELRSRVAAAGDTRRDYY